MDISNLTKNLGKGLEQKTNVELTALSRVLDIALGKVTIAQVAETIPVTPQERQALLNKTAEALQQLNKSAASAPLTPAAKEEIARLLEQQALIKSPDLKWVNLLVNNRQLLTYSDKPLAAGQTVTVRLVTPEKLVLLDLPESDSGDAAKPGANNANLARPASSATYSAQSLASQTPSLQAPAVQTLSARSIPSSDSPEQKNSVGETAAENPANSAAIKSIASSTARAQTADIQVAVVTETAPITPEERQELLKKTSEELLQLSKMAQSIPGLKQAMSSLLQQQALIKSPDTKWVHLSLDNQTLLTYSNKPLVAGQPVAVQVVTPQKILLLDMPELDGSENIDSKLKLLTDNINLALASAKNLTPTYFARLAAAEQIKTPAPTATEENPAASIAAKNAAAPLKIHLATVTETAPLLAEERTELLKKTSEELAQLSKMASSNSQPIAGLKEAINSLLQQQVLIKSPEAKWIHLQVGKQSLLTYSDKPLAAGQTVPVQAVTPQKILLLDAPEQAIPDNKLLNEKIKSAAIPQKNSTPTYFAKLTATEPSSIQSDSAEENFAQPPANSIVTKNTATATTAPAKIQMAVITETAPLLPDEREELLKKTSEELVQLNKMPSTTSGVKEAIASLLQQQALIKSPDTKWVHLSVNNQSLLTYSDKPLAAGQTVPVQVLSPQKIVLLDLPESNIKVLSESINAALANQKNVTPTYFARLAVAIAAAEKNSPNNIASGGSPANTAATKISPAQPQPQPTIQIATITQTAPITAEERQELLKKTSEELLQLNKMLSATRAVANSRVATPGVATLEAATPGAATPGAATPAIKEAIVSLLQQQALIKSPEAKWVHLQVNNQPLLTYSDKPLVTGQTVPLQVITPQKIQLLDLPEIKSSEAAAKALTENLPAILVAQKNSTPTYFAKLALPQEPLKLQDTPTPILAKDSAAAATAAGAKIESVKIDSAKAENARIEIATIVKTAPVNPQQRQELLQKINDDLNQINKLASTSAPTIPSVKDVISSLLEQQALLKSPHLKWLELLVNNRPISTYSEQRLSPGQTIPVHLTATQTLAILDSADLAVADDPATISTTTKSSIQPDIKPLEKFLAKAELPDVQQRPESSPLAVSQWQNTPRLTQQLLSPKTVEQALKSVAEKIRAQLQLNASSSSFEPGKKTVNESSSQTAITQPSSSSAKALVTTPAIADVKSPDKTADKIDSKNGQTQLLEEVDQVLSGTHKKLSIELTAKLLQQLISTAQAAPAKPPTAQPAAVTTGAASTIAHDPSQDLEPLIQQLLNKPANNSTNREARAQLLQLMQLDPETVKNMDIGKLTQHLTKGLEQRNNAELTALNRALNITLGKVVMADVTETAPVTPQERKELLAKTTEALTQLNKLASTPAQLTPALKAEIAQLLEQQALIKSPELKWANLLVNNRSVLTYTDKPLSAGQAVPVQLVDAQKLVLLNLASQGTQKDPATATVAVTTANSAAPTYSTKLATTALLTELEKNIGTNKALATEVANALKSAAPTPPSTSRPAAEFITQKLDPQHIKQVVADNLRRLLPYKDTPDVLLSALTQWQKLPATSQQRLAPVTVEQALKSVAEQIRSPLQIIQPKVLAQIIKHSGVFFENALHNSQAVTTSDSATTNLTSTDTAKTSSSGNNPTVAQTYSQDLKGSLLTLLSKVNQELTGSNKPLTEEQTGKLLQQLSSYTANPGSAATASAASFAKNNLPVDIGMFIQQVMTKPVKELSDKELRSHLLVLLQQHSVHSLAKIQLQQLANLNNEAATKDPSQPTASWQVEIPVRHHNEVQQLQLRIDREWVEEKNSSAEDKPVAKVKQWSVTLRFDLPTLGEFCAQLAIIDTSISATLWASEEKTFGQVRKQMDDLRKNLEKEGINVKQLQCMKGMPAQKPMALSYSLIDIST